MSVFKSSDFATPSFLSIKFCVCCKSTEGVQKITNRSTKMTTAQLCNGLLNITSETQILWFEYRFNKGVRDSFSQAVFGAHRARLFSRLRGTSVELFEGIRWRFEASRAQSLQGVLHAEGVAPPGLQEGWQGHGRAPKESWGTRHSANSYLFCSPHRRHILREAEVIAMECIAGLHEVRRGPCQTLSYFF